jgi:hypothetical protein
VTRFRWVYKKALEFIETKRKGVSIPQHYIEELKTLQVILLSGFSLNLSTVWTFKSKNLHETVISNTFVNSRNHEVNKDIVFQEQSSMKIKTKAINSRRIMWKSEDVKIDQRVREPLNPLKINNQINGSPIEIKSILNISGKYEDDRRSPKSGLSNLQQFNGSNFSESMSPVRTIARYFSISSANKSHLPYPKTRNPKESMKVLKSHIDQKARRSRPRMFRSALIDPHIAI